jgi:hypothetical protein
MGGLGSGRCKKQGRETVESYPSLDVSRLLVMGCLRPGWSGTCQWPDGNEVTSIGLRVEAERLHLSYRVPIGDGEWEEVADLVRLVRVPCRFGGSRPYFICPGFRDGMQCGRRIATLHLSRRYFRCRHCNRLPYASQYEQPWERSVRRADKLRQRLGITGICVPLPEKPKGMWVRTYARLLDKTLQAKILADEARTNQLQRLVAQIENHLK